MYHAVHGVLSYLECNLIVLVIGYKLRYNVAYYLPKRFFDICLCEASLENLSSWPLGFLTSVDGVSKGPGYRSMSMNK